MYVTPTKKWLSVMMSLQRTGRKELYFLTCLTSLSNRHIHVSRHYNLKEGWSKSNDLVDLLNQDEALFGLDLRY